MKDNTNKKKIKIIRCLLMLLLVVILIGVICLSNTSLKKERIKTKYIKQTDFDIFSSHEIDMLPYYIQKNNIELQDGLKINSNELYKQNKNYNYTIDVHKNNDIYVYNYTYKDKDKYNHQYQLFSTAKENMLINDYYETDNGYILNISKNIEYEEPNNYINNGSIINNDIEIQKYDNKNNMLWNYEIKSNTEDNLVLDFICEKKDNSYFFINSSNYSKIIIIDNIGNLIKEVDTNLFDINDILNITEDYIFFTTGSNSIIGFDFKNLEENFSEINKDNLNNIYYAYDDKTTFSYTELEYNYDKNQYKRTKLFEKEKYGLLYKSNKGNYKKINIRNDFDKFYKLKSYTYDFNNYIKYNNGYTYIPIEKAYDDPEKEKELIAILVYDNNIKLINKININNKEYLINNEKEKLLYYYDLFFLNNNIYVYGDSNTSEIIDIYTKEGKHINSISFDEDTVELNYDGGWGDMVTLNDSYFKYIDNYFYNNINYLKVTTSNIK